MVEDDAGIVGYIVATPDAREYQRKWTETWVPQMRKKYPKPARERGRTSAEVGAFVRPKCRTLDIFVYL